MLLAAFASAFSLPRAAAAYNPEVPATLAARLSIELPASAGVTAAAADAVHRALDPELADPEAFLGGHRFDAAVPLAPESSAASRVTGSAPWRLEHAAAALERAFRAGDREAVHAATASLAIAAADLADPFLASADSGPGVPGAHAGFSERVTASDLERLEPAAFDAPGAPLDAALALAARAASRRAAIELASGGDPAALAEVRRECLGEALAVASTLAIRAWRAAGAPALASPDLVLRSWPSPSSRGLTLAVVAPRAGAARAELLDVAGRRVWSRDLGWRPAGRVEVALEPAELETLPPGVYVARFTMGGATAITRWVRAAR